MKKGVSLRDLPDQEAEHHLMSLVNKLWEKNSRKDRAEHDPYTACDWPK